MANRIRELRHAQGITMKQLGAILGLGESTISQYETGKRQPDNTTLCNIADYFNVSTDYLLGRTDDPNSEKKEMPVTDTGDGLTEAEATMLKLFHEVPPEHRDLVLSMIEAALRNQGLL